MTGVMTQWMKDRLARQHEEARQEGREEGRLKPAGRPTPGRGSRG